VYYCPLQHWATQMLYSQLSSTWAWVLLKKYPYKLYNTLIIIVSMLNISLLLHFVSCASGP